MSSREAFEAWYTLATGLEGAWHLREAGLSWNAWQAAEQATRAPDGWKLVPIELTDGMIGAVANSNDEAFYGVRAVDAQIREDWAAMLDAAPEYKP